MVQHFIKKGCVSYIMRKRKSVCIRQEQDDFINKHRYSPSLLLQDKIDEIMDEYYVAKSKQPKPFVVLKHEDTDSDTE